MRGAAPSLVCPRCGDEQPPQDAVARFASCRKCGLTFDAAPKEREVPLRRSPPVEPIEVEAEAPPKPPKPKKPGALSGRQIVVILALLLVGGFVRYEYSPRYKKDREELEELERQNKVERELRMKELDDLSHSMDNVKTGIASCDQLMPIIRQPPPCPTKAASAELQQAIDYSLQIMSAGSSAERGCDDALAWVQAAQRRLRCK